ncbi:hypothetical protein DV736_g5092, partial [Chaetothyriales sp. CBS 134916]
MVASAPEKINEISVHSISPLRKRRSRSMTGSRLLNTNFVDGINALKAILTPGPGGDVLGVARGFLQSELIHELEDQVQWNKQVTGYERCTDGVHAIFADGSKSSEGNLLAAADRTNSAITRQLTDGKTSVKASASPDATLHPGTTLRLIKDVRHSSRKDLSLELGWVFAGKAWYPKIRVLFEQQNVDEAAFFKMSTANPDGVPEWHNDSRVALLGDAARCMTPAGGIGANTGPKDGEFFFGEIDK